MLECPRPAARAGETVSGAGGYQGGCRMLIRKIGAIGRTYRQIERYSEILGVLFKFGFGDLVITLKADRYLDLGRQMFFRKPKEKIEQLSRAERVRLAIEELGPTFIKLGQMLSTRPDLLPKDFIAELVKLQDKVAPFPFSEAQQILEAELGADFSRHFQYVEPEPMAAASIGQVHRAGLAGEEEVAIKVQRPGIRRIIEVDLEILLHLATLLEKHVEGWDVNRPADIVEEFGRTLERELDYGLEAANMERFARQHSNNSNVYIPKVHRNLTTARVLTMEYVEGVKASDFDRLRRSGYDLALIADRGGELVMEQTLVHGFFHADPHPGNLLILPDNVICLLDMGMTGRVDRRTRENMGDLVLATVRQDPRSLVAALLHLTEWEEEPDVRGMTRDASAFMDKYLGRPLRELELGKLLQEVFDVALEYRLRVPPDLLLLIKALSATEGLGRQLDPDFDIISKAKPFVQRLVLERYSPRRLASEFNEYGAEVLGLVKELPGDIRALIRLARKGKFKLEVDHRGLEEMNATQDRTSNRLAFSIVLASLIVGSSLIIQSDIPPTWHGLSIIGLAGLAVAGIMGFWLLISILKRGML
ncbi:MAG: AarF/ABC1/UbiB kinase family protein [Thermodesulfobacteriota bacterium]